MSEDSAKRPVIIICGKGGVGKTTLSLALGLLHAARGKKVVVVTSHPLPELAVSVSLDGLKEADATAAANLFVVHIDSRQVLAKMFQGQMPSKLLARTVLSSRVYRSLIEVAPGLKEMAFLSRLRELAERRSESDDQFSFQMLIWDAPATGHFLETMRVSQKFDMYLSGPFASQGREMAEFFSRRANLLLLPVATLEEMAVEETIELCDKLQRELSIEPAGTICNLVSPMLASPEEAFQDLGRFAETGPAPELKFVVDRHRVERAMFRRLRSASRAPLHPIQRVPSWKTDLELLSALATLMEAVPLEI
ncbi:MAG: AAA family ATPase [Acidobacteria bacterium]|nr:AAA family ATPase [Acidobacteriota bacterium]